MDRYLNDAAEAGSNGSVLVTRAGRTVLDTGYGLRDREDRLPNTPATVHAIGSSRSSASVHARAMERGSACAADQAGGSRVTRKLKIGGRTLLQLVLARASTLVPWKRLVGTSVDARARGGVRPQCASRRAGSSARSGLSRCM
ncbi:MAG: serine hydrolase [Flavobacteriales bacterium]|nr:serine hydrolase [Flavobacteriales bacterium]